MTTEPGTSSAWAGLDLTGKVAIVTGGAGGIGSATARLLAARGARVVVADIALPPAEALAHDLREAGGDAVARFVDLADESSIRELIASVVSELGRLDILFNNAAALGPEIASKDFGVATMPTEVWDETFATNVRGTMIAIREALPHLVAVQGNVVNTVSGLAFVGHVMQSAYSASKAALIQLTRSVATSHGRLGVRANAVAPGMILTRTVVENLPELARDLTESETLTGRLGEPQDIAEAVAFLASPAARHITGQVLLVDGGYTVHVPRSGDFLPDLPA